MTVSGIYFGASCEIALLEIYRRETMIISLIKPLVLHSLFSEESPCSPIGAHMLVNRKEVAVGITTAIFNVLIYTYNIGIFFKLLFVYKNIYLCT